MSLMDWAIQANLSMPMRRGFLQGLPEDGEVMITGDLHGHLGNLHRVVEIANLKRHKKRHLIIQELVHELYGEDKGACQSYRMVETAARLKVTYPNQVHYLTGNHEFSEVVDLEIGKNGRFLNAEFQQGLENAYGERWRDVKRAFRKFWQACPLALRADNGLFICHSTPQLRHVGEIDLNYLQGVDADDAFKRNGPVFHLLWGRDYSPAAADAFAKQVKADIFVVGHTPCSEGVKAPNHRHIILDSTSADGRYVIVPLKRPVTHAEVLRRVKRLF